jgi:hypothetical protein
MANSTFIKPQIYSSLTESQIYEWRKDSYENINSKRIYTKDELKNYINIQSPSMYELLEEISDQIKEAKILGKLTNKKDIFIYIDSSSMCKLSIPTMIQKLFLKYPEIKNSNLILVFSHISKAENMYKFVNNYPYVNYNILSFNMDLLTQQIPFKMKNVFILTTNLLLDNKLLMIEEQDYLSIFKKWKNPNIKNEINDNAQIQLTLELMTYFKNKKGFILSHDKMLCNKVKKFMTTIPNLYILESQDFQK